MINKIQKLLEGVVQQENLSIFNIQFTKLGHQDVLEISLMDENGQLDLQQAEKMTKVISDLLDEADLIDHEYILDVGSPGVEKELTNDQEIKASINQYVYVEFVNDIENANSVYGTLLEVNENDLLIEYDVKGRSKKLNLPKGNVAMIRLAVRF